MRAEAEGEGQLGMLMVGNVGVNRVLADCLDFTNIRDLEDMVFQRPGGFEATTKGYFYQRAREVDRKLARRAVQGERFSPAERSLWFFMPAGDCPEQWYGQYNTGRYKSHCFFSPTAQDCPRV
nr:cell wall hydrolase [Sporosarcina aquimarina]